MHVLFGLKLWRAERDNELRLASMIKTKTPARKEKSPIIEERDE